MKLIDINELNKYTNNVSILKLLLNLDDEAVNDIISLYKSFEAYNVAQDKKDAIIENYVKNGLYEYKIEIKKILTKNNFLSSVASMSIKQIKEFMKYCNEPELRETILTDESLENGKIENNLTMLRRELEKKKQIDKIRKCLEEIGINQNYIAKIIDAFSNIKYYEIRNKLVKLLTNKQFYSAKSEFDILVVIKYFSNIESVEHLNCTVKIINFMNERDGYFISDLLYVVNVIMANSNKLDFLVNKYVFRNNTLENIIAMINAYLAYPTLKLLINEKTVSRITWLEFTHLTIVGDLLIDENMVAINKELNRLLANDNKDNLYTSLLEFINRNEYNQTVAAYLNGCNTIEEFINSVKNTIDKEKNLRLGTVVEE
ncbi:MAG: hypothetical protein J1F35_01140 [Erysipelotrichales bacterium]|nr:hypothetical protein [Erysipelotrichales bacterium]